MHCDFFLRNESEGSKPTPRGSAVATRYCSGDRVASKGVKEGTRVIVNGAIEQIKSQDAKAMLGFVIDSIVVLSLASRHVEDAKIPN